MGYITISDKPYPHEKQLEGLAVLWAIVSGSCNHCKYLPECMMRGKIRFPADAACMVKKAELVKGG